MKEQDHREALEGLLELCRASEDPDPVDLFEDGLAARLGLSPHPGLSDESWRALRVAFIDSFGPGANVEAREVERELDSTRD